MNYNTNSSYGVYVPPPVPNLVQVPNGYSLDTIDVSDIKKENITHIPPQPSQEVMALYTVSNTRMVLAEMALQDFIKKGL